MSELKLWHGRSLSTYVYDFTTPVYVAADVDSEIDCYKAKIAELELKLAAKEFNEATADAEWSEGHPIFNLAQENDTYRARIRELEQRIKELEQDAVELRRRALNGPKISAVLEMLSNGNGLLRQIVGTHYDGNGIVIRIASNTIDAAIGASHE